MPLVTIVATKDAFMGQNISTGFSGWNGRDDHNPIGVSAGGGFRYRTLVYYPINFTGMVNITNATLKMRSHTAGSNKHCVQTAPPSSIDVRRITADWGEDGDPGEGNLTDAGDWDWDNMHDKSAATNSTTKTFTQGADGTSVSFDVTDIVRDWKNGTANYGVMFINQNESSASKGVQFYSRTNGDPTLVPTLEITYTDNTAPDDPINLTPSGVTVNTLTPNLNGQSSDPDSGDYITAVQVNVFQAARQMRWNNTISLANPGSGYIGWDGAGNFTAYETDIYGNVFSWSGVPRIWVVSNYNPNNWIRMDNASMTVTDNGVYDTLLNGFSTQSGTMTANEQVSVFYINNNTNALSGTTVWDSGVVAVGGGPNTFSIAYGSTGTPATLVGNRPYLWTARTRDKGNLWGPYATMKVFRVNTPPNAPTVTVVSSPINDINTTTPTFSIKHNDVDPGDQYMYTYQFVVEKYTGGVWTSTGGFDSGVIVTSPVTTKSVVSGSLSFGGHFRVKARTQDSSRIWSPYSAPIEFYTHQAGVPINLDPTGNENTSSTPELSGSSAYPSDVITAYWVTAYTDDLSISVLSPTRYTTGIVGGGTGFDKAWPGATLTAGNTYVWKARVETASGDISDWSTNQQFTVNDAAVPSITGPTGSANTLTPTITGSRASTFNRFQYEIYPSSSTSSNLGTVIYASGTLSATISGSNPTTFSTVYGGSPALTFATQYKVRARVSADAGSTWSNWSGLSAFSTDSAVLGTPQSPADGDWITTTTPSFYINAGGSDTIDYMQVRLWNAAGTSMIWDSGLFNVSNGTSNVGPITYSGAPLQTGTDYRWDFRYQKTTGAIGNYTQKYPFRINGAPLVPANLEPTNGQIIANTLLPVFDATFSDPDIAAQEDYPTAWIIRIVDGNGTNVYNKSVSGTLVAGLNEYIWAAGDYAFSYDTTYFWNTYFVDSKSAVGAYSALQSFRPSQSPNGTITTPTNGSTVASVSPTINWSYSGGTQGKFKIELYKTDAFGNNPVKVFTTPGVNGYVTSASHSYQIPPSYLKNLNYYDIRLTVVNSDGLVDPSPDIINIQVEVGAPNPITGLSITTRPIFSKVMLEWDPWQQQTGHTFRKYLIYRRMVNDDDFTLIGETTSRDDVTYTDWYAGHDVEYQYRVSVATIKTVAGDQIELESPDDAGGGNLAIGKLFADTWMFVGSDRSPAHVQQLKVVTDEDHNRPVQQEAFETLGSNRKVIIRGFVLGNEGNLTLMYQGNVMVTSPTDPQVFYEETVVGRRLIDYLTFNKGPHILKSPFGDVWDAEFAGPQYKWIKGGHLEVTLSWIETGQTSEGGSI